MYLKVLNNSTPYVQSADQGEKSEIDLRIDLPFKNHLMIFCSLGLPITDIFTDFSFHFAFWSSKLINVKLRDNPWKLIKVNYIK